MITCRDAYVRGFKNDLRDAREEVSRLRVLFQDVAWYNFEAHCKEWHHPWHRSEPDSLLRLYGHVYRRWDGGRRVGRGTWESAEFPVWYEGTVRDAPMLPPRIVLTELQAAQEWVRECEERVTAPIDWAPGGPKYEALKRQFEALQFSSEGVDVG